MRINFDMFCNFSNIKQREIDKNKNLKKLSSGKRVVGAAYDAAGLSISETMKAQIRGLRQANRNATDVISMLQVTDGGLEIISDMLHRMRELSIQSLSDTLAKDDRKKIQDEFRELKFQIDQVCENTNFNTKNVYEKHMPTYYEFSGNRVLEDTVSVISGYNDKLGIKVDGKLVEIVLDEGIYTFEELADMIDDKLYEVDKNLIISVNENRTLSLTAENYLNIEGVTGGAASFFYEYHLGMGAGVVYGSSDLSGRLRIVQGSNDVFSFNVEGDTYTINFKPSSENDINTWYTKEDIVNTMNEQLEKQNANVKVYMHRNNIAIDAGHRTIDGFSGNMIKIDGITSILYDNAKHGDIYRTQGYIKGKVDLTNGVEIQEGKNDIILLRVDGGDYKKIKFKSGKYANTSEVVSEINNKLNELNIEAYAEIDGNNIKLCSKSFGNDSRIDVEENSSSYTTLFRKEYTEEIVLNPNIVNGNITTATIKGRDGIGKTTKIVEGINDEITITVDGTEKNY